MNIWAVILAAGQGARLRGQGTGMPKQFLAHKGMPLFWRCAQTFARVPAVRGIVVVLPSVRPVFTGADVPAFIPEELARCDGPDDPAGLTTAYEVLIRQLNGMSDMGLPCNVALGGERRQDSVARGLALLPPECEAVLVHDGARPFADAALITRVADALGRGNPAVIPGLQVSDTIKAVDWHGMVAHTLERRELRAIQTPQGFILSRLREAHKQASARGWEVTDDASLLERCGVPVLVVEGDEANRKITTPHDLELLGRGSGTRAAGGGMMLSDTAIIPCSGFGYDVHRYGGDRPFILGGVPIACDVRVSAHSDGDTLLHALMDAMLGCIGGGDIGQMFPDNDPAFDNISSGVLLSEVLERCRVAGLRLVQVDITIVAQVPRIAPHRAAIAANVAKLLQLSINAVNVKATTEEHLGFTGEKKGIKVFALANGFRTVKERESGEQ